MREEETGTEPGAASGELQDGGESTVMRAGGEQGPFANKRK